MQWFVYVLVSASSTSTYVGISTDVERRLRQHNGELPGGAASTRRGRPWRLGAARGPLASRSAALRLEWELKQCRGRERIAALEALVDDERSAPEPDTK